MFTYYLLPTIIIIIIIIIVIIVFVVYVVIVIEDRLTHDRVSIYYTHFLEQFLFFVIFICYIYIYFWVHGTF